MKVYFVKCQKLIADGYTDEWVDCLAQVYKTREEAHQVYAHGEKACAEKGITHLHWSLEVLYVEERVEYGEYCVDQLIIEELKESDDVED